MGIPCEPSIGSARWMDDLKPKLNLQIATEKSEFQSVLNSRLLDITTALGPNDFHNDEYSGSELYEDQSKLQYRYDC